MWKKERFFKVSVLFVLIISLMLFGCKGTTNSEDSAFDKLTTYLSSNNLDLTNILNGWITAASAVSGNEASFYILDIRKEADFALGHLQGAVNTTLGNVLAAAGNNGGKPILVVCYTGQSAAHAVVALRLSGYENAKVLKFGMSSWDAAFDKWTANTGDAAVGNANWTKTVATAVKSFGDPNLKATATTGEAILAERVGAMLAGGFKGITNADVLASPANYFVNNYWAEADWNTYGHVAGAYRINPLTLAGKQISNLDPSKTIVTYCWTGQTSSMITAYLTVLGYDAKSLKFGANGMIHTALHAHKWTASGSYTYVH